MSRRALDWKKLRGVGPVSAAVVSTALGAGLFPVAPGTMGTLVGVPLAYWSSDWFWPYRVIFLALLVLIGTWAAQKFDQLMGSQDNQNIVIDEVIGMGITGWTAGTDLKTWVVAFLVFRFFDVIKIPPVRQIDQWSKNRSSPYGSGFGVIADDIVAGFQGLAVILTLQHFGVL